MSFILGLVAKHWKSALVVILLSGVGLYAAFEHHEATKWHDSVVKIQQAEKDATAQAKTEQAQADQKALIQAQALAAQRKAQVVVLQQAKAKASQRAAQEASRLATVYAAQPKDKAWSEVPIPASVLQALQGGGS